MDYSSLTLQKLLIFMKINNNRTKKKIKNSFGVGLKWHKTSKFEDLKLGWRCSYHLNLTELDWLFCHRTWSHIPCGRLHKRIVKKQRNFQSVVYKYVFKKNEEQMTHKHRRFDHGLNRIRVGLSKWKVRSHSQSPKPSG